MQIWDDLLLYKEINETYTKNGAVTFGKTEKVQKQTKKSQIKAQNRKWDTVMLNFFEILQF